MHFGFLLYTHTHTHSTGLKLIYNILKFEYVLTLSSRSVQIVFRREILSLFGMEAMKLH